MRTVYGLVASGNMAQFNSNNKMISGILFKTKYKASLFIEEFKRLCTTPKNEGDLTYLENNENLRISIIKFELIP